MSNSLDLLRMLEPAVRPVGAPTAVRPAQRLPWEEQSFEALLAEAAQQETDDEVGGQGMDASSASEPKANLLGPLSAMDAIDNASLRALIGRGRTEEF